MQYIYSKKAYLQREHIGLGYFAKCTMIEISILTFTVKSLKIQDRHQEGSVAVFRHYCTLLSKTTKANLVSILYIEVLQRVESKRHTLPWTTVSKRSCISFGQHSCSCRVSHNRNALVNYTGVPWWTIPGVKRDGDKAEVSSFVYHKSLLVG